METQDAETNDNADGDKLWKTKIEQGKNTTNEDKYWDDEEKSTKRKSAKEKSTERKSAKKKSTRENQQNIKSTG